MATIITGTTTTTTTTKLPHSVPVAAQLGDCFGTRIVFPLLRLCPSDLFTLLVSWNNSGSLTPANLPAQPLGVNVHISTHHPLLHSVSESAVLAYLNLLHIRRIKPAHHLRRLPFSATTKSPLGRLPPTDSRYERRLDHKAWPQSARNITDRRFQNSVRSLI